MKNYFLAFTIFFFASPALAGTGLSPTSSAESGFFFEIDSIGATSSILIFHFPYSMTTTTQQFYLYSPTFTYSGSVNYCNTGGGSIQQINMTAITSDTSTQTVRADITSGTISGTFYVTAPSPFLGYTYHATSSPPSISSVCQTAQYSSSSNWTSAIWDVDTIELSGGGSSYQYVEWNSPTAPEIDAPTQFDVNAYNIPVTNDYEWRFHYEVYDDGILGTKLYDWYSPGYVPIETSSLSYGIVFQVPVDLYMYTSTPYMVRATLEKRQGFMPYVSTGFYDETNFAVTGRRNTSTILAQYKPVATSSAERAVRSADCGGVFEFNLGCHFENLMTWLFVPAWTIPGNPETSPIYDVWSATWTVFPFSIFTSYNQNVITNLQNIDSTSNELAITMNISNATVTLPIAGRDYITDVLGQTRTNMLYNWIMLGFISMVMLAMVNGVIKLFT